MAYLSGLYVTGALSNDEVVHTPNFVSEVSIRKRKSQKSQGARDGKVPSGVVLPTWMKSRRFCLVLFSIASIVGVAIYNFTLSHAVMATDTQQSVKGLAQLYASEISRQLRTSASSLQALEAIIKIDVNGITSRNFKSIAQALIDTYQGITSLALSPYGRTEQVHPHSNFSEAVNCSILLHPDMASQAMKTIRAQETDVIFTNCYEDIAHDSIIVRRPVFAAHALPVLPDDWMLWQGVNYSRHCSSQNCSFPGPAHLNSSTYFWGFVMMYAEFTDLLRNLGLDSLEKGVHTVAGFQDFAYRLSDAGSGTSWASSRNLDYINEAVHASVMVPELSVHWTLAVVPVQGWQITSTQDWLTMLLVLPLTALLSAGLGIRVLISMRKQGIQMENWAAFRDEVRAKAIYSCVSTLNVLQFPLCFIPVEEFMKFGRLKPYEEVRDAGQIHCIDDIDVGMRICRREGAVFISHQWTGFDEPDWGNVQYAAMREALTQLMQERNCKYVWVDFCCIPQQNRTQQQSAVNSLNAYTLCCSIFMSIAPCCSHGDTGEDLGLDSYRSRAWCRLEKPSS
ncbi:unnamed protein product [Effrenium voratum]|nr:unnamed protein product [Effrenium voratum]